MQNHAIACCEEKQVEMQAMFWYAFYPSWPFGNQAAALQGPHQQSPGLPITNYQMASSK
jgi:hypothetical protein